MQWIWIHKIHMLIQEKKIIFAGIDHIHDQFLYKTNDKAKISGLLE